MSATAGLPFHPSESPADADGNLDPLLGKKFVSDSKTYMLVEANAAITSAAGLIVKYVATTGRTSRLVTVSTAATDRIVGVIPQGIGDIAANDKFLMIIAGTDVTVVADDTLVVDQYVTGSTNTNGRAGPSGATQALTVDFAVVVTAAAAAANGVVDILGELT